MGSTNRTKPLRQLRATNETPAMFTKMWSQIEHRTAEHTAGQINTAIAETTFWDCPRIIFNGNETVGIKRSGEQQNASLQKRPRNRSSTLKLVIGLISATLQCELRNVHRHSWMQYDHVCNVRGHQNANCQIFPVFVFANISDSEIEHADDTVTLASVPRAENRTSVYEFQGGD